MPAVPGLPAPLKALTVAPFGMEEGTDLQFPDREFGLIVGEPAEFRFFTSAIRKDDAPGDMLDEVDGRTRRAVAGRSEPSGGRRSGARLCASRWKRSSPKPECCSSGASRKTAAAGSSSSTCANESARMNIGIDLGTTNSALAYIDPAEAEDADFPPIHILADSAARSAER